MENPDSEIKYVSVVKDIGRFQRFKDLNGAKFCRNPEKHKEDYKEVRSIMEKMRDMNGYVLNPIILSRLFYNYLQEYHKSSMNIEQARNLAYVFGCLCNEYYLCSSRYKMTIAFFVAQKKWKRYMVGRKALENSLKILKSMKLIYYYNWWIGRDCKRRVRMYIINLVKLRQLLNKAQELKDYEDSQKIDYAELDALEEAIFG